MRVRVRLKVRLRVRVGVSVNTFSVKRPFGQCSGSVKKSIADVLTFCGVKVLKETTMRHAIFEIKRVTRHREYF